MGKAEIGSAKYISNKLKAKGLSKLKFYCQVCEKQCRDENGFKCHIMSKSHNERIGQLSSGSGGGAKKSVDEYSTRFMQSFLKLLSLNHGNKYINANKFYQEFIQDTEHVHLNSTKWKSLTAFVLYCQQQNKLQIKQLVEGGQADIGQGQGQDASLQLDIRYIDKYKESLISSKTKNYAEQDMALKYMEQQIQANKQRGLTQADEETNGKKKEIKGLNDSTITDQPLSIALNKPSAVVTKDRDSIPTTTTTTKAFKIQKKSNLVLPKKGNVFKVNKKKPELNAK